MRLHLPQHRHVQRHERLVFAEWSAARQHRQLLRQPLAPPLQPLVACRTFRDATKAAAVPAVPAGAFRGGHAVERVGHPLRRCAAAKGLPGGGHQREREQPRRAHPIGHAHLGCEATRALAQRAAQPELSERSLERPARLGGQADHLCQQRLLRTANGAFECSEGTCLATAEQTQRARQGAIAGAALARAHAATAAAAAE